MHPSALADKYRTILLIAAPTIVFIYLIITRPQILLVDNYYFKTHKNEYSIEHKYNEKKANQLKDIDNILDKIRKKGMDSLNKKEKQILDDLSREMENDRREISRVKRGQTESLS